MSKWTAESDQAVVKKSVVGHRNLSATTLEKSKHKNVCNKRQKLTTAQQLLSDVYDIFMNLNVKKIRTRRLLKELCSNEKKQWATFSKGNKLGARQLASMLHEFGTSSIDIRFKKGVFKGYYKEEIKKAWRLIKN